MKKCGAFGILVFLCFFLTVDAFAQRARPVEVRLASQLPRNSDWGRALDRLAADWARVTNNEVRLRISHDGLEGRESQMLSSLRSNNIQAALFLSTGLTDICPTVMTLSIPFFIKDDNELNQVFAEMLPSLEARVNPDYVIIAWAKGGWVNVFSKNDPVLVPDDLRRLTMATNPDMKDMNWAFRTMGFHLEETDMGSLGTRLNSNIVNAAYLIPAAIASMNLQGVLRNMMSTPIAPVMGAIVMNRVTWNRIPADRQRELVRVTRQLTADFDTTTSRMNDNALATLSRNGLKINRPSPAQEELWYTELRRTLPSLIGTAGFDRDLYDQINRILERSRGSNR